MAAFATCDSCLAGKAGTDLRDFKLLRITHQALERPSGVAALQGIYTTNLGTGYTLTITVDASGLVAGIDTNGCSLHGQVKDYDLALDVSACGESNGRYDGQAALISGSSRAGAGIVPFSVECRRGNWLALEPLGGAGPYFVNHSA